MTKLRLSTGVGKPLTRANGVKQLRGDAGHGGGRRCWCLPASDAAHCPVSLPARCEGAGVAPSWRAGNPWLERVVPCASFTARSERLLWSERAHICSLQAAAAAGRTTGQQCGIKVTHGHLSGYSSSDGFSSSTRAWRQRRTRQRPRAGRIASASFATSDTLTLAGTCGAKSTMADVL